MSPINIINSASLVIQSTMRVMGWIEQELKTTAAKDALQSLRDTLACLQDDIEFYQTQLSRSDVINLPSNSDDLDGNVLETTLNHSKNFMNDIGHTLALRRGPPSEGELVVYVWRVEHHRKTNKIAFKSLWYSLRKEAFGIRHDPSTISQSDDKHDLTLNAAPYSPFLAEDSTIPLPLHIFNSDRSSIGQYEEMMRRAGKGWVETHLRNSSQSTVSGSSNIDALKDAQNSLFEILWTKALEQWKVPSESQTENALAPPPYSLQEQEQEQEPVMMSSQRAVEDLEKLDQKLQTSIFLDKKQTFTTVFCGMAKAGKSLFLSALIGIQILPSDEFPSTAWPCRVRHVEGQKDPELRYDQTPFLEALKKLQEWKYGAAMKHFIPPTRIDDDTPQDLVERMRIWQQWDSLHTKTKDNLECFEDPQFHLEKSARGTEAVVNLLFRLNDIVRIYQRFGQVFGVGVKDWPLLTLEFPSLRDQKIQGTFEFIDLPGIGEHLQQFEHLAKTVAKRADAIVPVISLLSMQNDNSLQIIPSILNACDHECNTVICTNLDRVDSDNEDRQNAVVTAAFWPHRSTPPEPGIIRCSSLMGVSAQTLFTMSQDEKPTFETFEKPNIGYHAAQSILGWNGKKRYQRLDYEEWLEGIQDQITESGLPGTIEVLFRDIVNQARPRVMLQELRYVHRVVCNFTNDYSRILEGARRSRSEYDRAKEDFQQDKKVYCRLLQEWKAEEVDRVLDLKSKISHYLRKVEAKANRLILEAMKTVIQSRDESGNSQLWGWWSQAKECSDQVWELQVNTYSFQEFIRLSLKQLEMSLDKLRIQVIPVIEKLQREACKERLASLMTRVESHTFGGDTLKRQLERNIVYELSSSQFVTNARSTQKGERIDGSFVLGFVSILFGTLASVVTTSSAALIAPIVIGAIGARRFLRRETIRTDAIAELFRRKYVVPWVDEMEKKNGKVVISAMTPAAESIFTRFLTAEEVRFREELGKIMQPMDEESLRRNIMIYGNLVATRTALEELVDRTTVYAPTN